MPRPRSPRRIVAVPLLLTVLLAACGGGDDSGGTGSRLPDVELVAIDSSSTTSLADIEGPAVVNLWATWCAPCRREIPDFEAVHQARGDEIAFVGINVGEDADDAAAFISDVGATYEQWLDGEGFVVTELRTTAMPVTLVLDAEGRVSTKQLGTLDQTGLNDAIDLALAS